MTENEEDTSVTRKNMRRKRTKKHKSQNNNKKIVDVCNRIITIITIDTHRTKPRRENGELSVTGGPPPTHVASNQKR
jgi:hypothetical protein